jgi:pimeloyl-ACP methyl ester carboxylesterase
MDLSFLDSAAQCLTEPTSIALVKQIHQEAIAVPFSNQPISTTVVRQGNGDSPVLLLHGFDSSVMEFRRLLPLLSSQHETWAIDLLGFGFTDRPIDLSFNPEQIKLHLYHTWKTLINRPVVLVGASMGGAIAIDFALSYPNAVAALVLLDSAGVVKGGNMGRLMVPPLGFLATEFLRNGRVRQAISKAAYFDKTLASSDAASCAALHLQCPGWSRAMIAFTRVGGYNVLTQEDIARLQRPTLILWGRHDQILGTADAERFEQTIPNSKLIWIENCGHVPHLEKPSETAHHILTFLTS